ncbi:hypothetical protein [Oceanobacillus polygoni]|uniref:Uncharacterized protein n=2 Tax=Oceanobacillus polygoni TaxID=1235259 RepID=A0A9X0Z494_9BACI|nr:hypothetical protein [Oceanobacillus polygoni]MBP2080116.1 hypothetical protein [Oceanobacillus polygoni]
MDLLNISVPNTSFIAGYDYEADNGIVSNARFLYVEVVPNHITKSTYFIAGIEIDFINGIVLTMLRNVPGLEKENEKTHTTINQLRNSAKQRVLSRLGLSLQTPNVRQDRINMFNFCKDLDDKLLKDSRETLISNTEFTVRDSVNQLSSALFPGTEEKLSRTDKQDLGKQITALLLGYYISKYKSAALVRKAKEIKLLGYPTRVNFTSSKKGKSSTQSFNSKHPVSGSDMFHSLYFSFEQALGMDSWSISWFTDFLYLRTKKI